MSSICPYCSGVLETVPKRKKKCPHCGNYMYVRGGKAYTEDGVKRRDFLQPWLFRLENTYGVTLEDFEQARTELTNQFGFEAGDNDTIWRVLNKQIKTRDVYLDMASLVRSEGKDGSQYIGEINKIAAKSFRKEIKQYSTSKDWRKFDFYNCNDEHVCPECRAEESRVFDGRSENDVIDAANLPLRCTSEDGCRCWIVTVVDDEPEDDMTDQSDEWVTHGLDDWISAGTGAHYRSCNDSYVCPECRAIEDVVYVATDIPVPLYEKCTSPDGCRCWITPVVLEGCDDDELSSFKWATPDTRARIERAEDKQWEVETVQEARKPWYKRLFG